VIDFGSAQFFLPGKEYDAQTRTRNFLAPELLLQIKKYDYSIDIFSAGLIFAGMLFSKSALFPKEKDDGN
jgi:casein kinase II subunit alpha